MISLTNRYQYDPKLLRMFKSMHNLPNVYDGIATRDLLTFKFWNDAFEDRSFSPFKSSVHLLFL